MFFYGYASPFYLLLLWAIILITYLGTIAIGKAYAKRDEHLKLHRQELSREEKKAYKASVENKAKRCLAITIAILIVMLGVFKYAQFSIDNFLALIGLFGVATKTDIVLNIVLPVGLSFYLFQSIGYCIDVYREEVVPERNLFKHALFVSFFPQLLQGPIGNYGRLAPQLLAEHIFDYNQVKFGIQRVAWGFFKKLVIANRIANYVNPVWTNVGDYSGFATWFFFSFMYAIQLYADFSGYMDIACGCSQMLGIEIDENFNCPYFSKTIPEFWRRWHMTLSEWFKNYLFYPVLRSGWNVKLRKGINNKYFANIIPTALALAIVWFTTGLWHGSSWGYVAWGVYYGIFMMLAVVMAPAYDKLHAISPRLFCSKFYAAFQMLRTFCIVVIGYSIFKPADLGLTMMIWRSASCGGADSLLTILREHPCGWCVVLFASVILFAVDAVQLVHGADYVRNKIEQLPALVKFAISFLLIKLILDFGFLGSAQQSFEYFRF